jgi:hypothetical protein
MHSQLNGSRNILRVPVSWSRRIVLTVFFLLSFSTLKYFPGMSPTSEIWYVAVFLFLITLYLQHISVRGFKLKALEAYCFVLLIYLPISATYMANMEFGQPFLYGLLSQRSVILVGSTMIFLYLYRLRFFSLLDVERSLIWLSWLSLILYSIMQLTLDPAKFAGNTPGFAAGGEVDEAKFAFDKSFIVFGFFYYVFAGYWQKSIRNNLLALIFFTYLVLSGGRSLLVAVVLSYFIFIWRWSTTSKFLKLLFKSVSIVGILLAVLFITDNEKMFHLYAKLSQASLVVLTGKEGDDVSANARVIETTIAAPYIFKHWLLGNGAISNQWNEGYKSIFGYFYPADIGLIGVIYMFGLLGTLLFAMQFYFALRYSDCLPKDGGKWNKLVSAAKGFLLYYAIHSMATGRFANSVEIGLLFIAILYCAAQHEQSEKLKLITRILQ